MHVTLISTDDELWALGMRSVSASLRAAGHRTTMVFAGEPKAKLDERAMRSIESLLQESHVIGLSSMSRGSSRAKEILTGLRPLGRTLVWGGVHPTLYPEDCVAHADLVCRGEGEGLILDVVDRLANGGGLGDIPNGAYAVDGRTVLNELRPLVADLDQLPFPEFSFEHEYVLNTKGELVPNTAMRAERTILLSGSRGCNNTCSYCSNSQLRSMYVGAGRWARKMSVPAFITASKEHLRLFPDADSFYFVDEDFFARPVEEMRQLADTYSQHVGVPFECMASPGRITEEKVALASKAGMWQIDIGLESGSERVRREVFDRHVDDETQINAANAVNVHSQVHALYFLILGNPYEERQDLIDAAGLLAKMPPPFWLSVYNLVFIPGTKLFDRARTDGIIQGISDSAFELDFLAGFDHRAHDWKRKNLYLNSVISLMQGKATRWRLGYVPRILLRPLFSARVVDFCDRHPLVGETNVAIARLSLRVRRGLLAPLRIAVRHRRIVKNRR